MICIVVTLLQFIQCNRLHENGLNSIAHHIIEVPVGYFCIKNLFESLPLSTALKHAENAELHK